MNLMVFQFSSYELMIAGGVSLAALVALLLLKTFVIKQLHMLARAGRLQFLSYPEQIVDASGPLFMLGVALLAGVSQLELTQRQDKLLQYGWFIILVSQIALWGNRIVTGAVERAFERQKDSNPAGASHLVLGGLVARIVLWLFAVLVTLDNLGFNITTLMASLGVGGIAVALAVQNILGDIFSSVSISLDKPFVIGDFIVVDSYMGTVEYVGMKTTRLRSLGGEQNNISNTKLLKNRIRNYKRMQKQHNQNKNNNTKETPKKEKEHNPQKLKEII